MKSPRSFPWVTVLIVACALLVWRMGGWTEVLVYDRAAILHGEIWRLWTGHLVHFSTSHLGWDLFAVAFAGAWVELGGFRGGRWLWVFAPPLVSLAILVGEPSLTRYGGLSAMAVVLVVYAALGELRRPESNRLLWATVLALVALKIIWEYLSGETIFARFDTTFVRSAPLSHAAGALMAVTSGMFFRCQIADNAVGWFTTKPYARALPQTARPAAERPCSGVAGARREGNPLRCAGEIHLSQ